MSEETTPGAKLTLDSVTYHPEMNGAVVTFTATDKDTGMSATMPISVPVGGAKHTASHAVHHAFMALRRILRELAVECEGTGEPYRLFFSPSQ